jgi:hypothetical protein
VRRWRRFLALDGAQRGVLLWSLVLLPLAAAAFRWRGLVAAQAFIGRAPAPGADAMAPDTAVRMVDAAAALLGASCVPRSLVLWRLMRGRGAALRLGVDRSAPDGFAAHAWVELDGRALNDTASAIARYSAFPLHSGISGAAVRDR